MVKIHDEGELARKLLPAIIRAGAATMLHFRIATGVDIKRDGSPVTIADQLSEEILLTALAAIAPDIPVVAEEASAAGIVPQTGQQFFLVDPLDGTREFTNGIGEFTINIGLIEGGVPTFGIIYAPAVSKLYVTLSRTHAATAMIDPDHSGPDLATLSLTRINVRQRDPQSGLTVVASRSHGSIELEQWLSGITIADRSNIGSSLKFCLVAEGAADLYPRLGPIKEWDTAAGHAIVAAAGGTVTKLDGAPLLYGKRDAAFLNPPFIVRAQGGIAGVQGR